MSFNIDWAAYCDGDHGIGIVGIAEDEYIFCKNCYANMESRVKQLEVDLAKFHECNFDEDGQATACDGYDGRHRHSGVWHKDES
jgi:hypothetical protein